MEESVNFELRKEDGVTIFKITEKRLDASIAGFLKGELTILLTQEEVNKLIIDMDDVEYCDSSGLSAILLAYRLLQANEGAIRIVSSQPSVRNLIKISQLNRILPVKDSVEEAVEELKNL